MGLPCPTNMTGIFGVGNRFLGSVRGIESKFMNSYIVGVKKVKKRAYWWVG
jgi:hypothetical protein